jgi:ribosomal protein L20A (L18A)
MTISKIQTFNVKGHFKNKGEIVNFSRNVRSLNPEDAKEKVLLHFGAKHKIKRQAIRFESIKPLKKDDGDQVNAVLRTADKFKYIKG